VRRFAANNDAEPDDRIEAAGASGLEHGLRHLERAGHFKNANIIFVSTVLAECIERSAQKL